MKTCIAFILLLSSFAAEAGPLSENFLRRQSTGRETWLAQEHARVLDLAGKIAEKKAGSRVVASEVTSALGDDTYTFQMANGLVCQVGFGNESHAVSCL